MNAVPRITVDSTGMTTDFRSDSARDADAMLFECGVLHERLGKMIAEAEARNAKHECMSTYDVSPLRRAIKDAIAVAEAVR